MGADPDEPQPGGQQQLTSARSRSRPIPATATNTPRSGTSNQPGIYDQARMLEPRLKNYQRPSSRGSSERDGLQRNGWVLRRRGWTFPPLADCRAAWAKRYPRAGSGGTAELNGMARRGIRRVRRVSKRMVMMTRLDPAGGKCSRLHRSRASASDTKTPAPQALSSFVSLVSL